MNMIKM